MASQGEKTPDILYQIPPLILEDRYDVLAMGQQQPKEVGPQIQPIHHYHIKGAGVMLENPPYQTKGGTNLILPLPLLLHIQKEGKSPARKHGHHIAVIVLNTLPISAMDHPLQTPRTRAQVTGTALMAIYNKYRKPMGPLQGLVSLQSPVNRAEQRTNHIQVHLREHPAYRVSTRQRATHPSSPETTVPVLLQGIETPHTCQYHQRGTEIDGRSVDQRPSSGVSYLAEKTAKMIDLLYIPKKASENSSILSL
jgi:hypothetical protein